MLRTRNQNPTKFSTLLLFTLAIVPAKGRANENSQTIDYPNHHIHNFSVNSDTYEHAVAMGYRLVTVDDNEDIGSAARYGSIGRIRKHNAEVCPIRVYVRKSDGKLFAAYHLFAGSTPEGLNPVALEHGLERQNIGYQPPSKMTAGDLELLKGFGAAKESIEDLTFANATFEEIKKRFHTAWPLEDETYKSFNVPCNWQSRKVVESMIKSTTENVSWEKYDAIFFDTLSGGHEQTTNANYGGKGSYPDGLAGKLAFVQAIVKFVRDPSKTGHPRPYFVFTNIWDPTRKQIIKNWYASKQLRLDHYYFEKGSKKPGNYLKIHDYLLGLQYANGVIPGTQQPAYVNREKDGTLLDTNAYLPANLVALDDAYTWSRMLSKRDNFDHRGFFAQHLDACGTAGIQGSWFGWYGEDLIDIKDTEGRYLYDNANQLLRAIPNWDNMSSIPVPPYQKYSVHDRRKWDGKIYQSENSYASEKVVYSRNPDNQELYVVFRTLNASINLQPNDKLLDARFVNAMFTKTDEDARSSLNLDSAKKTLTLREPSMIGRGIRIKTSNR